MARDYSKVAVEYTKVDVRWKIFYNDYSMEEYFTTADFMQEFINKLGNENIRRVIADYGNGNIWHYRPSEYGYAWKNLHQLWAWQSCKHPEWKDYEED